MCAKQLVGACEGGAGVFMAPPGDCVRKMLGGVLKGCQGIRLKIIGASGAASKYLARSL